MIKYPMATRACLVAGLVAALLGSVLVAQAAADTSDQALMVSPDAKHSGARKLSKASLDGSGSFIFVQMPSIDVATVEFHMDDPAGTKPATAVSKSSPFDLASNGVRFLSGEHTVLAIVTAKSGETVDLFARFSVAGQRNPQPVAATPTGIPGNWTTAFSDDFDGTTVDARKWNANWLGNAGALTKPVNAEETSCYDPRRATVANGVLTLSAAPQSCIAEGKTYNSASGMVQTNGHFSLASGAIEARIWTPKGQGMWPAFWATGQNWPNDGEVDVLEAGGNDTSSFHYHYAGCGGDCGPGGDALIPGATAGWHTYAATLNAQTITWYYDGKQVWSHPTESKAPLYIVLNLATKNAQALPAQMKVDYVRAWK